MTTPTPPPATGPGHRLAGKIRMDVPAMPDRPVRPPQPVLPGPAAAVCPYCGTRGSLRPNVQRITRKRRSKFGVIWLLVVLGTGILPGLLLYLIWPRRNELVRVDRYTVCGACQTTL